MTGGGLGWWQQAALWGAKDLALSWRGRARLAAQAAFGVLMVLLFSFAAGPNGQVLGLLAPGFLWLVVVLSSNLQLAASASEEVQDDALEGLRLLGMRPSAMFVGAALVNAGALVVLAASTWPLAAAVYGLEAAGVGAMARLAATTVLGILAVCGPGTLLATVAARARGREMLLPLLLYPLLVPGLLAAVKATQAALAGDPMQEYGSWMALLVAFNLLYWPLGTALFGHVVEQA